MPNVKGVPLYHCTRCTYRTTDEEAITAHILDKTCPNESPSYTIETR